jgi:hypothetical protein
MGVVTCDLNDRPKLDFRQAEGDGHARCVSTSDFPAIGLGDHARPGCRRVRLALDRVCFQLPVGSIFSSHPARRVVERPRAGVVPGNAAL